MPEVIFFWGRQVSAWGADVRGKCSAFNLNMQGNIYSLMTIITTIRGLHALYAFTYIFNSIIFYNLSIIAEE